MVVATAVTAQKGNGYDFKAGRQGGFKKKLYRGCETGPTIFSSKRKPNRLTG